VPWLLMLTLPLWPMSNAARVTVFTVLFIAAEVIFWGGAALGGAELVTHRRRYRAVFQRRIGPRLRRWTGLRKRPKKRV
jgi:hypothetical protein